MIDFIFMLTRHDRTILDCIEVFDDVKDVGLGHIGFKDVGVDAGTLRELNHAIQSTGATSYMEVVSTSTEACLRSARTAVELGVDRLLGGTQVREVLEILGDSGVAYLPFPGRPTGHPTELGGMPGDIEADCRRFARQGCAGVDLLAYRATEADPIDLVRAARAGTRGLLVVAGSIASPERIHAVAEGRRRCLHDRHRCPRGCFLAPQGRARVATAGYPRSLPHDRNLSRTRRTSMADVVLEKATKHFGGIVAVREIDLEIAHNEFIVIVGPSGCGKSTTLRMIAGLEEVTSGTIKIGGRAVNALAPRHRNIAMVFQNYALYPHMSVRDNLAFGLTLAKRPKDEIEGRVREAAEILGLVDLLDRQPGQLSGGERQRVAMGRAIVRQPDVFLFDEPLSNLDAKLRNQMRTEIKRLHQKVRTTVVYVTHDQVEAMTLADRIVIMRNGIIEQMGKPDDIFHNPVNVFVAQFIGSPPMNLIDAAVVETSHGRALHVGEGLRLPLPRRLDARVEADREVVVGLRAEALVPQGHGVPPEEKYTFESRINIADPLGSETFLFVNLGFHEVVSKMANPRPVREGDHVTCDVDLARLHLFDRASGRVI